MKPKYVRRKEAREAAAGLLGGRCHVCRRKFGKGFLIHHIRYSGAGDHYASFDKDSPEYAEHVLAEVTRRPRDFAVLCNSHHRMVEMLKGMHPGKFEAMVVIVRASRPPACPYEAVGAGDVPVGDMPRVVGIAPAEGLPRPLKEQHAADRVALAQAPPEPAVGHQLTASRPPAGPPDDGHQTPCSQPPPPAYDGTARRGYVRFSDLSHVIVATAEPPQTPPVPTEG